MGTRCFVGYEKDDGRIEAGYVQFDGYPEHTGVLLGSFYDKPNDAKALVRMIAGRGGAEMIETHIKKIRFEGRGVEMPIFDDIQAIVAHEAVGAGIEYVYIFRKLDNKWYYYDAYSKDDTWHCVDEIISADTERALSSIRAQIKCENRRQFGEA